MSAREQEAATLAEASLVALQATMPDAEMHEYILNHSIVNGAIELLPQALER
jgi:hypothetical protein